MPALPTAAHYVVIGAGVHGLSTSMHLAQRLRIAGKTVGAGGTRIVVLDKTGVGAGASGIACGVVRNNYFQPAMRELMAHSVSVWERDPEAYSYHPVGYMQISPEVMHAQVAIDLRAAEGDRLRVGVHRRRGATRRDYMKALFDDWQARNITSVLHEKRGGYANNMASMRGLADKATALGVEIIGGVDGDGLSRGNGGAAITAVETDAGTIACDQVVVGVGPWINATLEHARAAEAITRQGPRRQRARRRADVALLALQEGTLGVDPDFPEDQRRRDAAGDPRRHRRAAPFDDATARSSPTSCGASTTSRTSISAACRAARCPAVVERAGRRRARRSVRTEVAGVRRHRQFRATCGRRRSRSARSASRDSTALYHKEPSGGIGASRPTASRCSTSFATTST